MLLLFLLLLMLYLRCALLLCVGARIMDMVQAMYCSGHRDSDMVDVVYKRCEYPGGCEKVCVVYLKSPHRHANAALCRRKKNPSYFGII